MSRLTAKFPRLFNFCGKLSIPTAMHLKSKKITQIKKKVLLFFG